MLPPRWVAPGASQNSHLHSVSIPHQTEPSSFVAQPCVRLRRAPRVVGIRVGKESRALTRHAQGLSSYDDAGREVVAALVDDFVFRRVLMCDTTIANRNGMELGLLE